MPSASLPTSVRLTKTTRALLDKSARNMRRSRSFLVEEALKRHLGDIASGAGAPAQSNRLVRLLALKGAGAILLGEKSASEIEARARAFRGDE